MAHELNNALAVVISSLGLMRRRIAVNDNDVAALADAALAGAERAAALIGKAGGARDAEAAHTLPTPPITREELADGIAHEFNNLLGIIGASLEMAEAGIADATARAHVTRARDAVRLGASLNRRLLAIAGRAAANPRRIDVAGETAALLPLIERTLGDRIRLVASLVPGGSPTLADAAALEGALLSLVVNARDAMPEGGTLTIACRRETLAQDSGSRADAGLATGDYVCLSLADSGHGMAEEVLRRCTEPFFTTRAGRRTGLGLASVLAFCRGAGGDLRVESEPGAGTTVSLLLPRLAEPLTGRMPSAATVAMGDGELILVVEDDEALREITLGLIESLGYTAIGAATAGEALSLLASEPSVALVLSDVTLPGGASGHDIARWLGTHRPDIRILLTSGKSPGDSPDVEAAILAKPYSRRQLAEALRARLLPAGEQAEPAQSGVTSPVKT